MTTKTHGRLGAASLAANTDASIYSPASGRKATCTVSMCNRGGTPVLARLAHIDGAVGTLAAEDYLFYDVEIPANGYIERTGITVSATHTIAARSSAATVSVVVHGVEEDA